MKWFEPAKIQPGQTRIVRKFLYFPRTFGRDSRWWEYANIVEKVIEQASGGSGSWETELVWMEMDFEDNRTQAIIAVENSSPVPYTATSKPTVFSRVSELLSLLCKFFEGVYDFCAPPVAKADALCGSALILPPEVQNDLPDELVNFLYENGHLALSPLIDQVCGILDKAKRNGKIVDYCLTGTGSCAKSLQIKTHFRTVTVDLANKPTRPVRPPCTSLTE